MLYSFLENVQPLLKGRTSTYLDKFDKLPTACEKTQTRLDLKVQVFKKMLPTPSKASIYANMSTFTSSHLIVGTI